MRALLVLALAACAARAHHGASPVAGDEITLYRDYALVSQRIDVVVPAGAPAHVKVTVPPGLDASHLVVLDRGVLVVSGLAAAASDPVEMPDEESGQDPPPAPRTPSEVTFMASAPHPGHHVLHLGYVTDALHWDAAYTMTTSPARDRVSVRGAVAIRNETGVVFRDARVFVVDAAMASWRGRLAEQLGSKLLGARTAAMAPPADLGRLDLSLGETRVPLLSDEAPRAMRSVLVYDPIGTRLDHKGDVPVRDAATGVRPPAPGRISESFEVARPRTAPRGLPGGPVRLLERRPDGSLVLLGEARLFEDATRVAEVDTIAIGTADGVTGHRERRDLTIDPDGKRLVEEFVLSVDNKRPRPVDVVLREHLYRGETWALAYYSARHAEKEGPQQISLRTSVAANSEARVLYVVVYSWADPAP